MSSSDIAISVKGLSKSYTIAHQGARATTLAEALIQRVRKPMGNSQRETFWALNDISLEIKKGDVVGVIGRNGAGKSTFLKILSRITEPTDGRIDLYGRVGSLLEVGTGFHPELTGRENVYLNGQILGMRRKEISRQFDAIVDFAGVERFLDTPVKRYSSGMYVRLAFAVAAHLDTEILLVDEVLAVGDAEFQKKCLGKMRDVASAGRTVLFVSHNMNAVSSLCQTGIFMQKGRVLLQASAREVLDLYSSAAQPAESFDLATHENRGPGQTAVLQTLTFFDENGRMSRVFKPLAPMRIEIEIQTREQIRIPKLSIGVTSSRGERVCAVASYLSQDPLPALQGKQRISCSLQLPALVPGRYTLDVGISDGDLAFLDAVYTAAAFDVAEDNYLGTTHPNFAEMGQVMVRSNWQVETSERRLPDRSPDYLAAPASADR